MEKLICWNCGCEDAVPRMKQVGNGFTQNRIEAKHQERWRHYCPTCKSEKNQRLQAAQATLSRARKEIMFERAMEILEGQRSDMYELREAIDAVEEFAKENPDRFDSAYEMVAAIILIQNRVQCKTQQKIGKYQVDFLLPDEFVVLEIDGFYHGNRVCYDSKRDREIRKALGPDWEVVRIATKYLDRNAARLVDAIREICDHRAFGDNSTPSLRNEDKFSRLDRALTAACTGSDDTDADRR